MCEREIEIKKEREKERERERERERRDVCVFSVSQRDMNQIEQIFEMSFYVVAAVTFCPEKQIKNSE